MLSYGGPFDGNAAGGTGNVTQAHIHLGAAGRQRRHLGVPVRSNPPVGQRRRPARRPLPADRGARSRGTITPAQVDRPGDQGIAAGEFDELVRAMRAGVTYANIHTTAHPGGEIRGQIGDDDRGRDH